MLNSNTTLSYHSEPRTGLGAGAGAGAGSSSSRGGASSCPCPCRVAVWGITIRGSDCGGAVPNADDWAAVLWRCLDELCAAAAAPHCGAEYWKHKGNNEEHGRSTHQLPAVPLPPPSPLNSSSSPPPPPPPPADAAAPGTPAALTLIDIDFNIFGLRSYYAEAPIIRCLLLFFSHGLPPPAVHSSGHTPWTSTRSVRREAVLRHLTVLRVAKNTCDESVVVVAAAAPAADAQSATITTTSNKTHTANNDCSHPNGPTMTTHRNTRSETTLRRVEEVCMGAASPHLKELSLRDCGLKSLADILFLMTYSSSSLLLPPQPSLLFLEKLVVSDCRSLASLEGLQHLACLEEIDASCTAIQSVAPLRQGSLSTVSGTTTVGAGASRLRRVKFCGCENLTSLEGLEGHTRLEEVDVSWTPIESIAPLGGCRDHLRIVDVSHCHQLTSLAGLEQHTQLETINAASTAITSIQALAWSPRRSPAAGASLSAAGASRLRKVVLCGCDRLTSLEGLQGHAHLEEMDASWTAIESIAPLGGCAALRLIDVQYCHHLTSLEGLDHRHTCLEGLLASSTAIASLRPLLACGPSLQRVEVRHCAQLSFPACEEDLAHIPGITVIH